MSPLPASRRVPPIAIIAFAALIGSAIAMGISPVFVRFGGPAHGGVGPFTGAFYRVCLALPLLWVWSEIDRKRAPETWVDPGWTRASILAGLFFAGDLFFWHLALFNTTIANATLLATMAPVWVIAFSLFIGERVTAAMFAGLVLCIAGGAFLVGAGLTVSSAHLLGDLYGVGTSFFFGLYFLVVRVARREMPAGVLLFRSSVVTTVTLAIVAATLESAWAPTTIFAAVCLLAMAWVSHVGGQGLLALALGHLSAAFSSLVIFLEALAAALFGWFFFDEALGMPQYVGGAAILLGIWIARPKDPA